RDGPVVTGGGGEHEGEPGGLLKPEAAPRGKSAADGKEYPPTADEPERDGRERGRDRPDSEKAAPTHYEIDGNRCAVETAGPQDFDSYACERGDPNDCKQNGWEGATPRQTE